MSAKANGAPTILPPRLPRATAPPAGKLRPRRDFIWCGLSIDASSVRAQRPRPGFINSEPIFLRHAKGLQSDTNRPAVSSFFQSVEHFIRNRFADTPRVDD